MRPNPPSLPEPKAPSLAERAAQDNAAYYRQPRLDGILLIFVHGWGMAGGHTGHVVQAWIPDTQKWSEPYALKTTDQLRATKPATLPEGVSAPEELKK